MLHENSLHQKLNKLLNKTHQKLTITHLYAIR